MRGILKYFMGADKVFNEYIFKWDVQISSFNISKTFVETIGKCRWKCSAPPEFLIVEPKKYGLLRNIIA